MLPHRVRTALRLALVLALLAVGGAGGQTEAPETAAETQLLRLRAPARSLLSRLQVGWIAWLSAINEDDAEEARAAVDRIQAHAAQVDMPYLPELSLAASLRAVEAVRAGQLDRARLALEGAEALDPGRPETAFAAAEVARAEGAWLRWAAQAGRGHLRTFLDPDLRGIALLSTASWAHAVLLFSLLAFAGVQMAVKGGWLYRDLLRALQRHLPAPLAHPVIWVLLAWPLALSGGPVWLALYWSVLLWGRGDLVERAATVAAWLLVAATPWVVAVQEDRIHPRLDNGVAALEAAADGRLVGSLVSEMSRLTARLPESVALRHAVADLERRLGECEVARVFYVQALESEPGNAAALADLGLCSYEAGSYERAIQYLQLAADSGRPRAQVQFNLSQALSELYRFHEAESALRAARSIDREAVNAWIRSNDPRLVVPVDGGLQRTGEIADELVARLRAPARWWSPLLPSARRLGLLAAGFAALALVGRYLLGADPRRPTRVAGRWLPGGLDLWRRVLLPGVAEGESDRWGRALVSLIAVVTLATLPWAHRVGVPVAHGIAPPGGLAELVAVVGLGTLLVLRFFEQRSAT